MSDQNQFQYKSPVSDERPRRGINSIEGKAFVSGVVFTLACRSSGWVIDWWRNSEWAMDNTAIMLVAPVALLIFLAFIWMSQQILRYYFGDRSFTFSERGMPIKARGFLAFVLGYFIASLFLSILASLL